MRGLAILSVIAAAFAGPAPLRAQDFVGFDRGSFGSVVLKRNQSAGTADFDFELAVGSYNNEEITNYSSDSVFARIGLSVGRLDILTDAGIFPCTAFIVSDKHILTNHHCVPGILENAKAGATRIDAVQFVAGYRQQGVEEGTRTYIVAPTPVEAHKDLDYALLEVLGNPSTDWGVLQLTDREPKDGDPYWVIGHPMGEAQRISREQCRANRPARSGNQLLHTCDTLPGNSGSPVIDASLQMVVGLHHAGSKKDSVNFAIPMRDILERSAILKVAAATAIGGDTRRDETPVASVAPDPCDRMWDETKAFDQCFAYKAYLGQCADHAYAWLARGYVEDQCSAAPATAAPPVTVTQTPPQPPETGRKPLLRPWCGASGLNATERAICDSAILAGLDAQLERAYAGQSHAGTADQRRWLATRDACGGNTDCIAQEMIARTAYLSGPPPAPTRPETGAPRLVQGSYALPDSQCYITAASRPSVAEATAFVGQWFSGRAGVRIFQSSNGWYGITVQTVARTRADATLGQLKAQGAIPGDSYCSTGRNFVAEVVWQSGPSTAGASGGYTMYVDNNAAGGLNVRSGPGTEYGDFAELAPGTALRVKGTSGDWSNITLPDGRDGWVYTPLLTATMPRVQTCWGTVFGINPRSWGGNDSFLAMRSDSSTSASKISELYLDDRVRVLARKDGWARVQCVSGGCQNPSNGQPGAIGWSSQNYISIRCN